MGKTSFPGVLFLTVELGKTSLPGVLFLTVELGKTSLPRVLFLLAQLSSFLRGRACCELERYYTHINPIYDVISTSGVKEENSPFYPVCNIGP